MCSKLVGYFNSIKVRLKLKGLKFDNYVKEFQFHKGTIKTRNTLLALIVCLISIP